MRFPVQASMDAILSAIFRSSGASRNHVCSPGNDWPPLPFLFAARVVPLLDNCATSPEHASLQNNKLQFLAEGIRLIQDRLREELLNILVTWRQRAGVEAIPLKGCDALLWGQGLSGDLHTRDLDVLLAARDYDSVRPLIMESGYTQVAYIDCESGLLHAVSDVERDRTERQDYYAYFPWSKIVPFPEIAPWMPLLRELQTEGVDSFPVITYGNQPCLLFELDVHHGVWPAVGKQSLRTEIASYDGVPITRVSIVDRLVLHGTHMGVRLMANTLVQAWGAFAQTVAALPSEDTGDILRDCAALAQRFDLAPQWLCTISVVGTLAERVGAETGLSPWIPQALRERVLREYLMRWTVPSWGQFGPQTG